MPDKVLWKPNATIVKNANITKFMIRHEIRTCEELLQRATTGIEWFWDSCVHETNISWFEPYTQLLDVSEGFAHARWFLGGRLNIAYNCLDRHVSDKAVSLKTAVIWQGSCGSVKKTTYNELYNETNQVACFLRETGVCQGNRVGLYMPMLPEIIPVFLAILKIGAVAVPLNPGLSAGDLAGRLSAARVKVLFTADGFVSKGVRQNLKQGMTEGLSLVSCLEKCVVIRRLGLSAVPMTPGRDVFYHEVVLPDRVAAFTEELDAEHEALVLYTAGTSGPAKGLLHTHGGILAQVAKEFFFNLDIKPQDVFYWATGMGSVLGPWEVVGALHFGLTLVISEDALDVLCPKRFYEICDAFEVSFLGASPSFIKKLMCYGDPCQKGHDLSHLRLLASSGEPLERIVCTWFFQNVGKGRLPVLNLGVTAEFMGSLLAPLVIRDFKSAALQSPGLGMGVGIYAEGGFSDNASPEGGILVCRKPAPSMAKGFVNAGGHFPGPYFERFKKVWDLGDWVFCDKDGQWFMKGRAEEIIKIAEKRFGPAELEDRLTGHAFISDAAVIHFCDKRGAPVVVCFVVLKQGIGQTRFLHTDIKNLIVKQRGQAHKNLLIHVIKSIPKTCLGDVARGVIKQKYLGQDPVDLTCLEEPSALKHIPQYSA